MKAPVSSTNGFDYGSVEPVIARSAKLLADNMRAFERQSIEAAAELGKELLALKGILGHGRFGAWLSAEFPRGIRTAQNFMSCAEAFGSKAQLVSYLPAATVYRLAAPATPAEFRADVLNRLEKGETMTPHGVDILVREARNDAKRNRRERGRREYRAKQRDPVYQDRRRKKDEREERAIQARAAQRRVALDAAISIILDLDDDRLTALLTQLDDAHDWHIRHEIRRALKVDGRLPEMTGGTHVDRS